MTNPCRDHFLRVTAAIEASAVEPNQTMAGATAYEHQLNQLLQDRLRLKQIQSNQGKAELKRRLLPDYVPYVQGVLEAGLGAQDEVLTTIMVWRFDAGDFMGGLDIAEYVLKHKMVMPDRFARTLGCLVAEDIATAALSTQKVSESFELTTLHRAAELTDTEDMPDQARSKLFLAMGRATLEGLTEELPGQPGQVQAGIDLLKKAIELHDACGGKKGSRAGRTPAQQTRCHRQLTERPHAPRRLGADRPGMHLNEKPRPPATYSRVQRNERIHRGRQSPQWPHLCGWLAR